MGEFFNGKGLFIQNFNGTGTRIGVAVKKRFYCNSEHTSVQLFFTLVGADGTDLQSDPVARRTRRTQTVIPVDRQVHSGTHHHVSE